ncbi:MAG: energy-coupling factor transporter ATPase [Clostridia bacterium]|nr:energy-coupling factor transporter ATPase [Clostridia bacterium]
MIELENISYTYKDNSPGGNVALDDVSLKVKEGEMWGIIGHTGSGKSTLLEIMSGLLRPNSGRVLFKGEDITEAKSPISALKGKVGLVFQYPEHQLFEESVIKDISFGPKNMGCTEDECIRRAREAMRLVGLGEEFENLSPFEISGGEKRRVAIAGILAMEPEVLILDEPAAGLDPEGRDKLFDMLVKIKGTFCKSIIFVSHSMDDVALYADKVMVMNKGKCITSGGVREVFGERELLLEAGLDVPQVARLIAQLNEKGHSFTDAVLTVEEAFRAIYDKLKG